MNCPKCRIGKLAEVRLTLADGKGGVELDQCSVCGGLWFDAGELERYLKDGVKVQDGPELHPQLAVDLDQQDAKCPSCAVLLYKKTAPQDHRITGDHCAKCGGLWLDGQEAGGLALAEKVNAVFDKWLAGLAAKKGAAHD